MFALLYVSMQTFSKPVLASNDPTCLIYPPTPPPARGQCCQVGCLLPDEYLYTISTRRNLWQPHNLKPEMWNQQQFSCRGKIYVHNNLCTLENHEKANRIIIISGTIICEGSKFFPYLQFGILSSGSHEKIHNICINVIIKLHFVFADILDVWSYQKHEFWSWLW